jgi:hypothetical protein
MQTAYNDAIYKTNSNAVRCRMLVFSVTSLCFSRHVHTTTQKTYVRRWGEVWIICEELQIPTLSHCSHKRRGTFYHKNMNVIAKASGNIRMCQSFQGEYPQRTDTQLEIHNDENKFS